MHSNNRLRVLVLAVVGSTIAPLSGCGNALIYGEGTNFSLTTLRLNDDAATPVRIVSGLDRTVGAVVPRRNEAGDAVNMSALFDLEHKKLHAFPSVFSDTLIITSEFASGEAAVVKAANPANRADAKATVGAGETAAGTGEASSLAKEIINRD